MSVFWKGLFARYLPTSMATSCHGSMFIFRAISAVFSPMVSWLGGTVEDVIGMEVPLSVAAADFLLWEHGHYLLLLKRPDRNSTQQRHRRKSCSVEVDKEGLPQVNGTNCIDRRNKKMTTILFVCWWFLWPCGIIQQKLVNILYLCLLSINWNRSMNSTNRYYWLTSRKYFRCYFVCGKSLHISIILIFFIVTIRTKTNTKLYMLLLVSLAVNAFKRKTVFLISIKTSFG